MEALREIRDAHADAKALTKELQKDLKLGKPPFRIECVDISHTSGRETFGATIVWEEGGVTSQQGDITDEQWEVLKLAFSTTGRIAILSDKAADEWMYDYRFLEAVR